MNNRNAFLWGMGTLGNLGGGYVDFDQYLLGDNASDLRKDWEKIGQDMRLATKTVMGGRAYGR